MRERAALRERAGRRRPMGIVRNLMAIPNAEQTLEGREPPASPRNASMGTWNVLWTIATLFVVVSLSLVGLTWLVCHILAYVVGAGR